MNGALLRSQSGPMGILALLGLGSVLVLTGCASRPVPPPPQLLTEPPTNPAAATSVSATTVSATPAPAVAPKPAEPTRPAPPNGPPVPPSAADLARIENLVAPSLRPGLSVTAANALAQATDRALEIGPSGRPVPWTGDGLAGTIIPQPLRRTAKSAQCRTFVQAVGSKSAEMVGCKAPGGTWAITLPKSGH